MARKARVETLLSSILGENRFYKQLSRRSAFPAGNPEAEASVIARPLFRWSLIRKELNAAVGRANIFGHESFRIHSRCNHLRSCRRCTHADGASQPRTGGAIGVDRHGDGSARIVRSAAQPRAD